VAIRGFRNSQDEGPPPPYAPLDGEADLNLIDGVIADADPVDLTATSAGERYSAWADRLRDKRVRDQAHIRGTADGPEDAEGVASNWNADRVVGEPGEHDFVSEIGTQTPREIATRLGVLGLEPGASPDDIALAYRQLAKTHHPDRWATSDEATQLQHSEEMLRVNAAYRALRAASLT
jgi:DnaJ-domain-containing protein 1